MTYIKKPYEDGKLFLNDKDGYYVNFGKKDEVNIISFYHTGNPDESILVFNDLITNGYFFKVAGKSFGISYPDDEITLVNPEYLNNGCKKVSPESSFYVFSVLHEIGHSHLHKSNDKDFNRFKKELQAWVWAIEKAKTILPEYFKTVDNESLKIFIIKCLMDVKSFEK